MIYTTREININGSTATIDEDIYLFKQDSNIELKFIINDTRFTFQTVESSNVIESSNASYFRVKLLNPYGKTINFPIQEVTDNYIVLLINGELIDEDTEVGDYTIQIRLYDKDKNSKLTLPAIANCIHIQQPIFNEVEENTIDTAAIDTASVMESDEGELPVVDSTGKYIPTLWDTGDTISKAKMNHIEKGILQAHIDALADKLQVITAPEGTSKPDIITLFNELPESGFVYIKGDYLMTSVPEHGLIRIYGLCSVESYTSSDSGEQYKNINCYSEGYTTTINSSGDVVTSGFNNVNFKTLISAIEFSTRKKGQVLTMTSDSTYGWANVPDTIPQITPPEIGDTSNNIILYNELPESGLVYLTNGYNFPSENEYSIPIIGLCAIISYTSQDKKQCKSIACYNSEIYVNLTSDGNVVGHGMLNTTLDNVLNDPQRKKGQVLTMTSDSNYGWGDVIPQITPPKHSTTSDIVNFYNMLPESGLVFIVGGYTIRVPQVNSEINKDVDIVGLCSTLSFTSYDAEQCKTIVCYSTATFVQITSTGEVLYGGMCNQDLDHLMEVLTNSHRKKGQVLTMKSNSEYGWADTTPEVCIHNITGNGEVQLTLDPYQLINISDATPQDLSSKYTVGILTPNIEESDNHVYKIHVIFMGYSNVDYIMPSGVYNYPTDDFTAEMVYEFIFTYVKPKWLVNGSEYSIKHSNAPV